MEDKLLDRRAEFAIRILVALMSNPARVADQPKLLAEIAADTARRLEQLLYG